MATVQATVQATVRTTIPSSGSAALWIPTDEWDSSSLKLWLDASTTDWKTGGAQDYLTINTTPDPDTVSQWDDRSGNNNHCTQATEANQPILGTSGGERYVDVNATTKFLQKVFGAALSQPVTVAFLGKQKLISASQTIHGGNASTNRMAFFRYAAGGNFWALFAGAIVNTTILANTNLASFISTYNGASSIFFHNGLDKSPTGTVGTNTLTGVNVGNNYQGTTGGNPDLYDFIIINSTITTTQQEKLEGYFAHKLNTQYGDSTVLDALDVGHPYKISAPTV